MNYEAHYNKLIERAQNRLLEGYSEKHHVLPRCMGGSDNPANIAVLTAREHYIAHQLLVKMYPEHHGLAYAAYMMGTTRQNNKAYGWLRRASSKAKSIRQTGSKRSAETRAKMSASAMGIRPSAEARVKMSIAKKGKPTWNKGLTGFKPSPGSWKKGHKPWNVGKPAYTKQLMIDGVVYRSRKEASEMLNKDVTTILNWLANGKAIDMGVV